MEIYTQKTIDMCPYTATILKPPFDVHKSTFFVISFLEKGSCTIDTYSKDDKNIKTISANENDCLIISPFVAHKFHEDYPSSYVHRDVHVDYKTMKECCDFVREGLFEEILNNQYPPFFRLSYTAITYFAERCTLLMGKDKTPEKDIIWKNLISAILSHYVSSKTTQVTYPTWINALLRNLNSESFITLSIEKMVQTTNYSHGYVNREFKKYFGKPLKQYVNDKKLHFSIVMLSTTDISLQDIVDRLGFTTISNYINVFKQKYGITPAKYRKTHGVSISNDTYIEWGDFITL